jgi:YD repeat-containing protein
MIDLRRISVSVAFLVLPVITQAQVCTDFTSIPGIPAYLTVAGSVPGNVNCNGAYRCYEAIPDGPVYSLSPLGCDPMASSCTAIADVQSLFPGSKLNYTNPPIGVPPPPDSLIKLRWTNELGQLTGTCGNLGSHIQEDIGICRLSIPLSCATAAANPAQYQFILAIDTCEATCPKRKTVNLNFLTPTGFCPELPAEEDCEDTASCSYCKVVGSGLGGGKGSAAGGGGIGGGPGTGPRALLRYKAGGAGMIGHPGATAWRVDMGMFWSHDYAERLFVDPSPAPFTSRVYQVTKSATYVTWGDASGDGTYESRQPASGYERLVAVGGGWELTELDGAVTVFDSGGRWQSTTDRFGNAKTATYVLDQLVAVDFADQRREEFTYHGSGKLATITEIGIDGVTDRTWSYTWTGENLTRIDLPDGRALEYVYGDLGHPGYMTQTRLIGTDTSVRITAAFEYDPSGNVVRLWRGNAVFASGVDRWQFDFDDPNLPEVVTVTDPLGDVSTYTFDYLRQQPDRT